MHTYMYICIASEVIHVHVEVAQDEFGTCTCAVVHIKVVVQKDNSL